MVYSSSYPSTASSQQSQPSGDDIISIKRRLEEAESANLALKRRLEEVDGALADALAELKSGKRRKQTKEKPDGVARGVHRLVDLYITAKELYEEAHRQAMDSVSADDHDAFEDVDPELKQRRERMKNSWNILVSMLEDLRCMISDETVTNDMVKVYLAQVNKAASEAKSDDIKKVKEEVVGWLGKGALLELGWSDVPPNSSGDELRKSDRLQRGFPNNITGYLLCPIEFDWSNEDVRSGIRNANPLYAFGENYFIRVLYAGGKGHQHDVTKGFLRSALVVKAYKVIFTSTSSANVTIHDQENIAPSSQAPSQKKATKKNVATILGLDKVTPRSIAYAAIMLVFNLTNVTQWSQDCVFHGWSFQAFYHFLVDYLDPPEGESEEVKTEARQLLKWWNLQIFTHNHAGPAVLGSASSRQRLAEQRAAKAMQ